MSKEKKRLFFALWPGQGCCRTIIEQTRSLVRRSGGRPVKAENLHLTLAFLHSVDSGLVPCIVSAAKRAAGQSFHMQLSQTGYWRNSQILWLGPAVRESEISQPAAMVHALWRELAFCGFSPEKRPFQPHLTLARRAGPPARRVSIPAIDWPVSSFVLVESITGQRQSEYVVLQEFALSRGNDFSK